MKKITTIGLILKFFMVITFYFWDVFINSSENSSIHRNVAMSSSDSSFMHWDVEMGLSENSFTHKPFHLGWEQTQLIPNKLNNELSDLEHFEHLESAIAFMMGKYDIKGASIAVAKDGRLVFAKGIGYADAEEKEPVEPRHLFRIASVSKLITATTIMKMTELDLLDINDKVFGEDGILNDSMYLDYVDSRVENITVRHLLNHSSGWNRRYENYMAIQHIIAWDMKMDKSYIKFSDILRYALKNRLHFDPGSRTSYSNLGYAILGEVIEAVTGINYESYVQQTILYPLGIQEMRIGKSHLEGRFEHEVKYYKTACIPEGHSAHRNDMVIPLPYGGNDIEILGPAGGWIASPAEIMKLVVSIDTIPGTPDLLSAESIEMMTDIRLSGGHPMGWAGTDRRGNWWRTGTLSGTSALVKRQNNGLSWAVFFNSSTYMGISLPRETDREVGTALNQVENWPEHDLFYHFETTPYLYPDIAELR